MWHLYFKLKPQQREVAQGFRRYPEALIVVVNDKETTQSQAQRVTKSDSDTCAAPCSESGRLLYSEYRGLGITTFLRILFTII